jgi:sugar-specific transcriptional regulator TrmB
MPNTINEENILIQAGLSEDQAQVYDYLLDKGPQKASSISSWTGVKRGLTYKILEQTRDNGPCGEKRG